MPLVTMVTIVIVTLQSFSASFLCKYKVLSDEVCLWVCIGWWLFKDTEFVLYQKLVKWRIEQTARYISLTHSPTMHSYIPTMRYALPFTHYALSPTKHSHSPIHALCTIIHPLCTLTHSLCALTHTHYPIVPSDCDWHLIACHAVPSQAKEPAVRVIALPSECRSQYHCSCCFCCRLGVDNCEKSICGESRWLFNSATQHTLLNPQLIHRRYPSLHPWYTASALSNCAEFVHLCSSP